MSIHLCTKQLSKSFCVSTVHIPEKIKMNDLFLLPGDYRWWMRVRLEVDTGISICLQTITIDSTIEMGTGLEKY